MNFGETELRRLEPLDSPGDFEPHAVAKISSALTVVLADMFALYIKTKNFHWHISGPHGGTTLRSIGHIARLQRVADNDREYVAPRDMLVELREDNRQLTVSLRSVHTLCDEYGDVASASLIENWIDEAEHRAWFLFEATR